MRSALSGLTDSPVLLFAPYQSMQPLADIDESIPRSDAVAAYLHERNGDLALAARRYASAARNAPNLAERDYQSRQAARLHQLLRDRR